MARNTKTTSSKALGKKIKYFSVPASFPTKPNKISRCGLKPTKERLYRYIDMVKIKHKKV